MVFNLFIFELVHFTHYSTLEAVVIIIVFEAVVVKVIVFMFVLTVQVFHSIQAMKVLLLC